MSGLRNSLCLGRAKRVSLRGPLRDSYECLIARLDNLRRIAERPEVYFGGD